jgi:hypothetical protein
MRTITFAASSEMLQWQAVQVVFVRCVCGAAPYCGTRESDAVYKNLCKNDRPRRFIAIKLICVLGLAYGLEPLFTFRCLD